MSVTRAVPKTATGKPPRNSAATRSRAATRTRLLEAGRSLFASRGLHRVTSHDIARQAGVAAGTFYLHFRDKRDLFGELARDSIEVLRERLAAAGGRGLEGRQGVRVRTEALVIFVEENRDMARILFSADSDAAAVESEVLGSLADAIAEGRRRRTKPARGTTPLDPGVLSQALVGMLARVVAWWAQDPRRASRETVIDTLTRIQLSGTHPA